jgi:predicted Rossmann-fold nucleotide-binding protein
MRGEFDTMASFSVTVFCGSSPGVDPIYAQAASELGQGLAGHGMNLVFGGGNVGLMGRMLRGLFRIFCARGRWSFTGSPS